MAPIPSVEEVKGPWHQAAVTSLEPRIPVSAVIHYYFGLPVRGSLLQMELERASGSETHHSLRAQQGRVLFQHHLMGSSRTQTLQKVFPN